MGMGRRGTQVEPEQMPLGHSSPLLFEQELRIQEDPHRVYNHLTCGTETPLRTTTDEISLEPEGPNYNKASQSCLD